MENTSTPIDRQKLLSLGYLSAGRTRNRVVDGRRPETGERCKHTTDELGNTVTESSERQDVTIRPQTITVKAGELFRGPK